MSDEPHDRLGEGLFERFRLLSLAIDREDRFVPESEEGAAATGGGFLATLRREGEAERASEELVLRALRAGLDPINFDILKRLAVDVTVPLAELAEATGLDRIALGERVNDLIQVGLAAKDIETRSVSGTAATLGLVELVSRARDRLSARVRQELDSMVKGGD